MSEQEIYIEAIHRRDPAERRRFLDEVCAGNEVLRGRIETLIRQSDQLGSFLENSPQALGATADISVAFEKPGTQIGPYKLLQQIGEGGMGTVYMAEQSHPVQRKVALKVIKAGMDSSQVIARFEAERQALALMDHPNIAKVLDAGTTAEGRPYFVMELVQGVPITQYCDENHLSPKARLELFTLVCQAVQHAHHKGVIHRDLKPTNVLVTLYDDRPVPKVIDFGVAKATGGRLTERTMFTGYGQIVGTLEYMSPEQARLNALDVDTRGDIYSLGVLLYELLTGTTPFDKRRLREAAFDEMLRIIREEEPPKPSTRLSTAEGRASIAANRSMEPSKLSGLVRGELDWIVMKALEKDRNRRYETANSFAMDVQRYLDDQPVLACPPSPGYRLRKFVRRNKGPVLAGSLVFLALVVGVIGTTLGYIRAERAFRNALSAQVAEAKRAEGERRAKDDAQKRLRQIEMGTEVLASVFRDLDPKAEAKEGVTLRVLLGWRLGEAVQQLEGEAVGDPRVVARLQHLLGNSLRELGHPEQAEVVLVKARQTREKLLGADHLDTIATKHNLAGIYRDRGDYAQAEKVYQEVLKARSAQLGPDHTDTLSSKNNLALLYMDQRQLDLAEMLLIEILEISTAKLGDDDPKTLQRKNNLAGLYELQQKYAQAETLSKEVMEIRVAKLGPDHRDTLESKNNLAGVYVRREKYDLAESLYKEGLETSSAKLGPHHVVTLTIKNNLAGLYHKQEKYAAAVTLLEELLEVQSTTSPADHPQVLRTKHNVAAIYQQMRKFDLAIPLFEETLKHRKAKLLPDHPDTLHTQAFLGLSYRDAGRIDEAIHLLEEVHLNDRKGARLAWVSNVLLTAYELAGKKNEATALVVTHVQAARTQFPADSPRLATALFDIGKALLDGKAYAEAEPLLRESVSLRDHIDPNTWDTNNARSRLGEALLGQKKYADAEPLLLAGYQGVKKGQQDKISAQAKDLRIREALLRLVELYDAWAKPDEAAEWRKELENQN